MKRFLLVCLSLAAACPLAAQSRAISPAPSVLFAEPALPAPDTIPANTGMPQKTAATIGFVVGATLGYLVVVNEQGSGCGGTTLATAGVYSAAQMRDTACGSSPNGTARVFGAIVGGIVGTVIGSLLAGPDAPTGS